MNDLTQYLAVRDQIRAGDVIAFQGSGLISGLIRAFAAGPSHIGIVRVIDRDATGGKVVMLVESTIEGKRNGVQTNRLSERLANYDARGRAWWLPLSGESRKDFDWAGFYKYIGESEDRIAYDTPGLFHFLARSIPVIGPRVFQSENAKALVCSGFAVELFEQAGLLRGINNAKETPQDLCEAKLYAECVQILGTPGRIARFNSV